MSEDPEWQALRVRVLDTPFLIAVSHVSEVLDVPELTPVSGTKAWFLGLASAKGNVLPVSDLGGFLFGENSRFPPHARLLVCESADERFALLVDEVGGLIRHPLSQLDPSPANIANGLREFVREVAVDEGIMFPVLQPELVINSAAFLDVGLPPATSEEGK